MEPVNGGQLKVGCVGCSDLAVRGVLPHLVVDDAKRMMALTAVCDIDPARAKATAQRFGATTWFSDYEQLLSQADVDVVLILTPIGCHAEQAIMALDRDKHVYLQKPMAANLADAERVVAVAKKSRGHLMVAPVNRLCPMTAMLKDVIAGGAMGTIYSVMTATHFPADYGGSGFDRSWHYGAAGGPIRDRTIYSLTTLTDLFGAARRVTAMSNLRNPAVRADAARAGTAIDDNSLILLEFADGVQAVASGTFSMEGEVVRACFLGVYGSDGTIETTALDPLTWFPTEARVRTRDVNGEVSSRAISCPLTEVPGLDPPHDKIDEGHVYADIAHLADGVLSGRPPLETAEQARHIVDIIEKTYGAAKTGQTQALTTAF